MMADWWLYIQARRRVAVQASEKHTGMLSLLKGAGCSACQV